MYVWKRIKQSWDNYLARMAKSNREIFTAERRDCCAINRIDSNTGTRRR